MITDRLVRIRSEIEQLLFRMSAEFSDRKQRLIFLINNYDLIVTLLNVRILLTL